MEFKGMNIITKKIFVLFVGFFIIFSSGNTAGADQETGETAAVKYYTAYNIWIPRTQSDYYTLHFKTTSNFLPAGTEVKDIKILEVIDDMHSSMSGSSDIIQYIQFSEVNREKTYKYKFYQPYHPELSIEEIKNRMFTTKTLDELCEGLEEGEIAAIKTGLVTDGMSREAVFIAYGPPADHKTQGYDSKRWTYYLNRKERIFINFIDTGKTVATGKSYIETNQKRQAKSDAGDIKNSLLQLKELKDLGAISEQEFEEKKKELLDRI